LYSRLSTFKTIAAQLAVEGGPHPNPTANTLGLPAQSELHFGERPTNAEHYYDLLLESCERLFDNELEQHAFEDQMRFMFGPQVNASFDLNIFVYSFLF
jgi:paired amphipathic helix protein Sin3a